MESCVKGFSYMPENGLIYETLKYVESDALEQTWKVARRERMKQREQKIWDEFVKEQDIVSSVYEEDPYQFIDQLPESCIKELLEKELQKMKQEDVVEQIQIVEETEDKPPVEESNQCTVTVVEDSDKEKNALHIFDDKDISGTEEEGLNESLSSPCTVREREAEQIDTSRPTSPDKMSSQSSENVSSSIENSIYCAKIKDLRTKMNEELTEMALILERNTITVEPEEVQKMTKRATEFCSRFNRVHVYQLQRQIHEVRRHEAAASGPPHTHRRAQLARLVSLHQGLLHALTVAHKFVGRSGCPGETGATLESLLGVLREATVADLACKLLFNNDDMKKACDRFGFAVKEYSKRTAEYTHNAHNPNSPKSRKDHKVRHKRRSKNNLKQRGATATESRLSMYSLETGRRRGSGKSAARDSAGAPAKARAAGAEQDKPADKVTTPSKTKRLSPRRRPRVPLELHTLVETVAPCTSCHMSREPSFSSRGDDAPRADVKDSPPADSKELRRAGGKETRRAGCKESRRAGGKDSPRAGGKDSPRGGSKDSPRGDNKESRRAGGKDSPRAGDKDSPRAGGKDSPRAGSKDSPRGGTKDSPRAGSKDSTPRNRQLNNTNITPRATVTKTTPAKTNVPAGDLTSPRNNAPRDGQHAPKKQDTVVVSPRDAMSPRWARNPRSPRSSSSPKNPRSPKSPPTAKAHEEVKKSPRDKSKADATSDDVSRLIRELCGTEALSSKREHVQRTKNVQLVCINGNSPRQPTTPQLLKILEETIQKKSPRSLARRSTSVKDAEKYRMMLNIPESISDKLFEYRTKFVQHMLTSSLYANSAVGKPWEMIGSVSEQIIDELLLNCASQMELNQFIQDLFRSETQ